MSRNELVQRYLDGQMSRRVFIRGLVATGVTTATALSYASVLESLPAGAVVDDFYMQVFDNFFAANPAALAFGQNVSFRNWHGNVHTHSATDNSGMALFDTGLLAPGRSSVVAVPSAGTYTYRCKEPAAVHPQMKAQLSAPLLVTPATGTLATTFTVRWAAARLPSGYVVDVQQRAPGSATWAAWKTGVTTRSATFKAPRRGTWAFRARLRRTSNGKASGWSTPKSVQVS